MGLREDDEKRSFASRPEPPSEPATRRRARARQFVVQKHAASRLHYDFRLELEGVLKSWSVPKGPSLDPNVRRLAMATEDHPLAYADFEGVIPRGQYGAGTVIVWDAGTWTPLDANPHQAHRAGKLHFALSGKKLKGAFVLERRGPDDRAWVLVKLPDARASSADVVTRRPESVVTGRTIEEVSAARDRVWHSNRGHVLPDVTVEGARPAKPPRRLDVAMPTEADAVPDDDDFLHEVELPGERLQARFVDAAVRLESAGHDVTGRHRSIVEALERTRLVDAILDGIVVGETYVAFDLLRFDGNDLRKSPLEARKLALEAILAAARPDPHLHYASHVVGHGAEYFAKACELGALGVVSKRRTSKYGEAGAWRIVRCQAPKAKPRTRAQARDSDKAANLEIAGVRISNATRVMYPARGTTKWEIAQYYEAVGDWIVPHVVNRPLTLVRCGAGLQTGEMREDCTFLRHGKAWGPKTLRRVQIREKTKVGEYLVADDLSGVIGLVQMDVLEIHTWNSTANEPELANRVVFDLDPGPDVTWKALVRAARTVRTALAELGLECWVKTTGGAGLHVVAPVAPTRWEDCLAFVRKVSSQLALGDRTTFTTSIVKSRRRRKIYLDYLRNNRGNTSVAAYSTRARPDATVSVPLDWDELGTRREPFDVDSVRRRVQKLRTDPWAGYFACKQALPGLPR